MAMTEAPAQVLDCRGMQCPMPIIQTARAIKQVRPGQVLELLATDPGVAPDMTAWTSRTGNELLGITQDGDVYKVLVRRFASNG
ncbi:MAG: sulfurtransferase TusA family protein [Acidimicrobiia bacterium]